MKRVLLAAALVSLVAGCSSSGKAPQGSLPDRELNRSMRLARVAFNTGDYPQALNFYRDAASRGEARDDALAIADAHYGAGASLLRQHDYRVGLDEVAAARSALALVDAPDFPELRLLEATLYYRLGNWQEALRLAESLRDESPALAGRGLFLSGLVASDRGDSHGLKAAAEGLDALQVPELDADRRELDGRLALMQGRYVQAADDFEAAAGGRRESLDYEGMTRALTAAAEASQDASEHSRAAELFLRAGRSAAVRGASEAADLLRRAETAANVAGLPELAAEARERLRELQLDDNA
jgi:tetratricopeptide (TPR) repeat protein